MRLIGKNKLEKAKKKNKGNNLLIKAIDKLIDNIEANDWKTPTKLKAIRPDADKVHSDGFYFFNINVHRTMIMIEFDEQEATVVWIGTHEEYETVFQNNKNTIKKWLKLNEWI